MPALFAAFVLAAPALHASDDEEPGTSAKPAAQAPLRVWVLTDQGGATEAGFSSSGRSGIVPFEVTCSDGKLISAQRKLTSAGIYGTVAWTVRVRGSLASEYGSRMLHNALENICKTG